MTAACIGEPISWLRLETFAAGARDATVAAHLETCPACQRCLDEIRSDVVVLPPLVVPASAQRPARRPWWQWAAPGLAVAAAVAIAIVVIRPKAIEPHQVDVASIKGGGTLVLSLVRDREGSIRDDVTTFRDGDRWKVVVTCSPEAGDAPVFVDVSVKASYSVPADFPLAPVRIACGNHVVVPGAFSVTNDGPGTSYQVCVRVTNGEDRLGRHTPSGLEPNVACVTIKGE